MRIATPISNNQRRSIGKLLSKTKSKADFQRVQCMWLRASFNFNSENTALAVGLSQSTVKKVQSRYLHEGEKILLGKGRGGKRYSNLTLKEEDELLSDFMKKASAGGVLVVNEIKVAYEKKAGKEVPKSTVYRMLARHGWRKIAPRPKHPQSDPEIREDFKKNFLKLSKKRWIVRKNKENKFA